MTLDELTADLFDLDARVESRLGAGDSVAVGAGRDGSADCTNDGCTDSCRDC